MVNLLLNYVLIPKIGIFGAAIATCISYISVFIFRYFNTKKYVKLKIFDTNKIIGIILLLISSFVVYVDSNYIYIILFTTLLIELLINLNFWKKMLEFCLNLLIRKKVS